MGCVDSTIHTVELYSLLNQITKQSIRNAISEDNIMAIADLESETNYPTAIQLSQTGLLWTTLHFCCRFDAPNCLQYFLRKCYLQEPNQYVQFVNHQTIDGNSALHLCSIWNSQRCLFLLIRYGALNLGLKNKSLKTLTNLSQDYSRKQITQLLLKYEKKYGKVIPWNYQLLQVPLSFKNQRQKKFYDDLLEQLTKNIQNKDKRAQEQLVSKQQLELRLLKEKLEEQKEQLYQKRVIILSQIAQKQNTSLLENKRKHDINEGPNNAEFQLKKKEVSKEEFIIDKKIKQKQQELQNVKKAIDLLQYQSTYKLLKFQQQKALAGRKNNDQIMKNFVQLKIQLLKMHVQAKKQTQKQDQLKQSKYKEEIIDKVSKINQNSNEKNTSKQNNIPIKSEQIVSSKTSYFSSADMAHFNKLPKHIQLLYQQALAQGSFEDKQFAHNIDSLGGSLHQAKIRPFLQSLVWLRPSSFLGANYKLFDGIDSNDVKQGLLGVCYCLATISDLAQDPKEIVKIFPFYDLNLGLYVLKFYAGGKPTLVVVDDYFPCNNSSLQPFFSKPIGLEVWVLLIQKAWAKLVGSYFGAEEMTPQHFMQDLTGYPTYGCFFKNKTDKLKDIIECSQKHYPIVLTTGEKKIQGIISNHSYSLLQIYEHQSTRIYKVRNPWGRFQWNGRYGQNSLVWTPQLRQKCEAVCGDQGIFFLSEAQILQIFVYYSIAFNQKGFNYSFVSFSSKKQESKYFKIVHREGKASLRVSQPFRRMMSHKSDYRYSPVVFEVGRIQQDKVIFVSQGNEKCFVGQKSVYASNDVFTQYEPGEYFVRLKVQWALEEKYNQAVLSYFGKESISIQPLAPQIGLELWNKMLFDFAQTRPKKPLNESISYSMHWMRAQMICYAQLDKQAKSEALKLRWQFNPNQLKNCYLQLKKANDNTIQYELDTKMRKNLGTVTRLSLLKSCSSGSVSIQSQKV